MRCDNFGSLLEGGAGARRLGRWNFTKRAVRLNFKAGRAKLPWREILEASLNKILKTCFSEILKASPGTNFKSGALGCAKILKPCLQER